VYFRLLLLIAHFPNAQLTIAVETQKRSLSLNHGKVNKIKYQLFVNFTNNFLQHMLVVSFDLHADGSTLSAALRSLC
jgi:hypothetical protein